MTAELTCLGRRSLYLDICGHEMHVSEWGERNAPALVMWHGLARTGRDFDVAARHFARRYRVICPDTLGRGLSGWSANPDRDYTLEAYADHAVALLTVLGIERCKWVGTSMGGLLGMSLAAGPLKRRIERLVVNDIGPRPNPAAITRIRAYVTARPSFANMREFEAFLRRIYLPFGPLGDREWRAMAETSARRRDDGSITVHYDPEIMRVFADQPDGLHCWPVWDGVDCPTLVLRGEDSDVLLPEVAEEMTRRGPGASLVTLPGCGHAPMLNVPDQIQVVENFLAERGSSGEPHI
ncbi:alpha/beta fold hydrolase [Magnetospirillum sp. SS-4]|uniref:alpha/beta fold hydrolase n=1 Tax=Magnetospirillum sp. SS-4 TaxID=2681465 RepID=UPI00137CB322|nr:alpha/beta hydrolase [Magnetospirillum sp. SS-4]CAA7624125.1 Predicted hydrolase or acyltransferase [Magnetospirillum sp. SS-4]